MANLNNSSISTSGNSMNSTVDKAKAAVNSGLASIDPNTVDQLNHLKDEAMDRAAVFYEQTEKVVRQNPFYFIGGAAVLGYLVGSMISRKH